MFGGTWRVGVRGGLTLCVAVLGTCSAHADPRTQVYGSEFSPSNARIAPVADRLIPQIGALGTWSPTTRKFDVFCTAALINERFALTAAHCIDDVTQYGGRVFFYPGKVDANEIQEQFRPIPLERVWLSKVYYQTHAVVLETERKLGALGVLANAIYASNPHLWEQDWAVVELHENAPWRGLAMAEFPTSDEFHSTEIYSLGYPSDREEGTLWYTAGKTFAISPIDNAHGLDSVYKAQMKIYPGASGSPVFVRDREQGLPAIAGVVTRYLTGEDQTSFGMKLDRRRITKIQKLMRDRSDPHAPIALPADSPWITFDYAEAAPADEITLKVYENAQGLPTQPGIVIRKMGNYKSLKVKLERVSTQISRIGEFIVRRETHRLDIPGERGDSAFLKFDSEWQDTDQPLKMIWR